jgi:uncharacterized membrane protein YfcA
VGGVELVFESWQQLAIACAVVGVAQAIYVLFGFGAGLIAVGALAALLPSLQDVVVLLLLTSWPVELAVVAAARREVRWRGVALVCAGIAVGVPFGTWALRFGDPAAVLGGLGVVLVAAAAAFLAVPTDRAVAWPRWTAPPVGLLSGVLSGLFGTGGPPLVFYYQLAGTPKAAFRAQLMAIFLVVGVVRFPSYAVSGLITWPRAWSSLALMPAVILGAVLGHRLHVSLSERAFRRLVGVSLILIGLTLLLRSLSGAW